MRSLPERDPRSSFARWKRQQRVRAQLQHCVSPRYERENSFRNWLFPGILESKRFGTLHLKEASLFKIGFYSFYYAGNYEHPKYGSVQVIFHPQEENTKLLIKSLADTERRVEALVSQEESILESGQKTLRQLCQRYEIKAKRVRDVFPNLRLRKIKLSPDGDYELVYSPCESFPNLDLFIAINRKLQVTKAHFDD
jgi:hypothetical protein